MIGPAARKRFRIVRALGEGGMGLVYEAYDHELHCRVALKTLRQLTADSLARFKREFRTLQGIHHPNLVRLGELISSGDEWFFTMELVEGSDFLSFVRPADPRRHSMMQLSTKSSAADLAERGHAPTVRAPAVVDAVTLDDGEESDEPYYDDDRVRAAMRQLGEALAKLHAEGIVHRDVKASNIRLDRLGRLVLLDFGLVVELDGETPSSDHRIVGTPAYMAPEQANTEGVGPEADLYSAGVVLYEALTGRHPFEGSGIEILIAKQREVAPRASDSVSGVAADLDDLCAHLLDRDPAKRPTAARLARAMQGAGERTKTMPPPAAATSAAGSPFVGRQDELAALARAYEDARAGRTVAVLVQGESGVGKSSLARRFVDPHTKDPNVCVLAGRCYEREAVPYKAFDGVVDSLTRFLMRLPHEAARALLPTKPAPLVQVFPVLRRVSAVAALTTNPLPPMDPIELRDRAFAGLRDLLTRLAGRYTVLISIDDAQWADADSIALLAEVLRPPEAPSLLFLATVRTTSGPAPAANQSFHGDVVTRELHSAIPCDVRVLRLERLSHEQACELARSILGAEEPVSAAWVAEEADGHPLFIDALARYSRLHAGTGTRVAVRLDEAISAPIHLLQENERKVLELLAISSGPVAQDVLASAAELAPDPFARAMSVLRAAHLVMTSGSRGSDTVELYHDRIRVAVKQNVRRDRRPELHRRLATALESSGSGDAQALAAHWFGARDSGQAARYAKMAADHATHALAFDRAANLYDWALRLEQGTEEARGALYERLGNAHASAGRGARAAHAFRKAARHANAARALDLRRRAAEQLLRAGHIDEGLEAMRGVLGAIGMRLPQTRLATLVSFFFWLVVVRIRGLSFRRRDTSEIAAHELTRIDTCWSVALGLSITDTVRGAVFHNRALVLSLRAGETYRVARALSLHAGFIATSGGRRGWGRAQAMLERARELADESNEPHAIGWAAGAACVAHYTTGHFKDALGHFESAERIWRESPGTAWEIDTIKVFAINSLAQLGSLAELCARAPKYLRETMERGDLYGAVNLRIGYANLHWLVLDRPAEAKREIDEAMEQWSKQGTHLEHFYELLARTNLALYEGTSAEGLALLSGRWPHLDRALLFRVQSIRILAHFMRARLEVAVGLTREGSEREALFAGAARDARAIARERMDWARPLADLIVAACALDAARAKNGRGPRDPDNAAAIRSLRAAAAGFDASDMRLHAVVARRSLGALLGGEEGAQMTAEAAAWMRREGVVVPGKMAAMLGPGLGSAPAP